MGTPKSTEIHEIKVPVFLKEQLII